ncbi:MAG: hypothetical protein LBK44_05670 [Spirochaetales bacterium]|jgi:hypothetical protein|nr:hypothetical protein [Spirochaetales bacterium]
MQILRAFRYNPSRRAASEFAEQIRDQPLARIGAGGSLEPRRAIAVGHCARIIRWPAISLPAYASRAGKMRRGLLWEWIAMT